MKSKLEKKNWGEDIIALRDRYNNIATTQQRINEANKTLDSITYKNECAMSFEKISSKLQLVIDTLTDCDCPQHNKDIVDLELNVLKAQKSINPREYTLMHQDIPSQVPTLS